jgi:hypothetical protein
LGITKPTAGHVHRGAKGVAGPVVVDLDVAKNGNKACIQADRGALHEIVSDPAAHYINLHTPDYPNGAMRGQLTRGPLSTPEQVVCRNPRSASGRQARLHA